MKRFTSLILSLALVLGLAVPALATTGQKQMTVDYMDIHLSVDGVPVGELRDSNGRTVQPFACEGTTYLPVRAVGEALGKEVRWDGPTHTVYISDPAEPQAMDFHEHKKFSARKETINADYLDIRLVVDGKEVTPKDANGKVVEPFAYNGTTYLPVRAVGEALGKTVRWDGETQTVHLGEMPQGTYLVDACKTFGIASYYPYRAADGQSRVIDGKRYSQCFYPDSACGFGLGEKYESLTFDVVADGDYSARVLGGINVYLDGELAQTIETPSSGVKRVTVPLNYAKTVCFNGWNCFLIANAVLNGEREAPAKPVPPADATYLVDVCETTTPKRKAAENQYFTDTHGNHYTNGITVGTDQFGGSKATVSLNGRYKTLKATIVRGSEAARFQDKPLAKEEWCFSVDGATVAEIEISHANGPQTIEIPLNYGMTLEIKTENRGHYLILADAILE